MKYIVFILASLVGVSAYADGDFSFKPYIGAEYDYVRANYKDDFDTVANESFHGGDIHIGARVNKYLGFEVGYLDTAQAKKTNVLGSGINTGVKLSGETLDAMGYLPINGSKFDLLGTVGVSHLKAELTLKGAGGHASASETEYKPRLGAGAQYWVTDNLNVRGIVRYQGADFDGAVGSAVVGSLGVNWQF